MLCCTCSSKRANIRVLPCGHTFHDRCLFPWPSTRCPTRGCCAEIRNFECMSIEPFQYDGMQYKSSNLMHVFGMNRRGRWTEEEYEYAVTLIEAFNAGLVYLPESLKLGTFLCKMLQCCAARLSSKIRKGKKVFHSKRIQEGSFVDPSEISHYRSVQKKLSDAEELFLKKIAASFDPEEASVLSYHIQHSWMKGFLASTHYNVIKDKLFSFNSQLYMGRLDSAGSQGQSLRNLFVFTKEHKSYPLLQSIASLCITWNLEDPNPSSKKANNYDSKPNLKPNPSSHLQNEIIDSLREITSEFPYAITLVVHLESSNVLHSSTSLQRIISQFSGKESFLTLTDFEFVFKDYKELIKALSKNPDPTMSGTSLDEGFQVERILNLMLIDDDKCTCYINSIFLGTISLSTLRFMRHSLIPFESEIENLEGQMDPIVVQDQEIDYISSNTYSRNNVASRGTFLDHLTLPEASLKADTIKAVGINKKQRGEFIKNNYDAGSYGNSRNHDRFYGRPYLDIPEASATYSSASMSLSNACGNFFLISDRHQVPHFIGNNLPRQAVLANEPNRTDAFGMIRVCNSGLPDGDDDDFLGFRVDEILVRDPTVNIVSARGNRKALTLLSSAAPQGSPTLLSASTSVNQEKFPSYPSYKSPRNSIPLSFESILQSFLRVIPFHVVEIWVPVQLQDTSTVLLYGASAATDKELCGWSSYSRNFSFNPDVGLPGRVASARTVESCTDVAKMAMPSFLRAEMAESLGMHAACGLPFFTGSKCDAVIVFYSRHIFEPTLELVDYMGKICEMLNIRAQIRVLKPKSVNNVAEVV